MMTRHGSIYLQAESLMGKFSNTFAAIGSNLRIGKINDRKMPKQQEQKMVGM